MPEVDNVYHLVNADSKNPLILTCEHASSFIPEEYNNLGLPPSVLDTHIARDKGCGKLTKALAEKLGCTAFLSGCSRLFIDYNRRINEESLILSESDKVVIPGNQNLTIAEREYRIANYHQPYYQAIKNKIAFLQAQKITPRIFSIHGFTPQLKGGAFRPWNVGVLYIKENPLALQLLEGLKQEKDLVVGANVPYDLRQYNTGASAICGEDIGLENAVIEIRDTEFTEMDAGVEKWCDLLFKILSE